MQKYIDLFLHNWFVFVPIAIVLLIALWTLIRKGYLQTIEAFGLKLGFRHDSEKKPSETKTFHSTDLKNYEIKFTKTASGNISSLGITEAAVIQLVQHEFTHHVNYFLWDLQDYPLPVQLNYIVVLDKIGNTLTIRAVKRVDIDEAQIASINNLLADYRRLTRYEYRLKGDYVLRPEMQIRIRQEHDEVILRLLRHFKIFRNVNLANKSGFGYLFLEALELAMRGNKSPAEYRERLMNLTKESPGMIKGLVSNIVSACLALREIDRLRADAENRFISEEQADREIVMSLERSLQHIHKVIDALFDEDIQDCEKSAG